MATLYGAQAKPAPKEEAPKDAATVAAEAAAKREKFLAKIVKEVRTSRAPPAHLPRTSRASPAHLLRTSCAPPAHLLRISRASPAHLPATVPWRHGASPPGSRTACPHLVPHTVARAARRETISSPNPYPNPNPYPRPNPYPHPSPNPHPSPHPHPNPRQGGKKGVEIEGASDMGGLDFFCTTMDLPDGVCTM